MIAQNAQIQDGFANPTGSGTPATGQPSGQTAKPATAVPNPTPTPTLPAPQMVPGSPVPAASAPPIVPNSSGLAFGQPNQPVAQPYSPNIGMDGHGNAFSQPNQPMAQPYTPTPQPIQNGSLLFSPPNQFVPQPITPTGPPPVNGGATGPTPVANPGTAGVTTGGIEPMHDLRSQVITPGTDPRLGATQGNVSALANTLTSGPNRFDIAKSNFDAFAKGTEPQYNQDLRRATDLAAANGRLGSGMLSNNYETLAEARARALDTERTGLLNNALEGTIGDTRANLGLMSGLESQQFGEGQANRNELRNERGYENDLNQQALQNRVQEAQLEDQLTNSGFARGADATQVGYSGNPASAQLTASAQQGDQANQSFNDVGSLLRMMALSHALEGSGSGMPSGTPSGGMSISPGMLQQFMSSYRNGGGF